MLHWRISNALVTTRSISCSFISLRRFQLDYVFVDSHTGIADIGGSLLFKYANAVCAFFFDNRQNREGMLLLSDYLKQRESEARPEVFWIQTPHP